MENRAGGRWGHTCLLAPQTTSLIQGRARRLRFCLSESFKGEMITLGPPQLGGNSPSRMRTEIQGVPLQLPFLAADLGSPRSRLLGWEPAEWSHISRGEEDRGSQDWGQLGHWRWPAQGLVSNLQGQKAIKSSNKLQTQCSSKNDSSWRNLCLRQPL